MVETSAKSNAVSPLCWYEGQQSFYTHFTRQQYFIDLQLQEEAFHRGFEAGKKDLEVELLKRGKALYAQVFKRMEIAASKLIESAESVDIDIIEIHLRVENWDCATSLVVVKTEDYLDDKIDNLYEFANKLSEEINSDNFHWDYSFTYFSESMNKEKIISDGFHYCYEHSNRTRQTQQVSV